MREGLWDKARGIGIILVVFGHIMRSLTAAHVAGENNPLAFTDFALYTFHMPLFFMLAGINAARSLGKDNFIKSKIPTIVYPYLLWSVINGVMQLLSPVAANNALPLSALAQILWQPVFHYWFLHTLFICVVLAYLVGPNKVRLAVFAAVIYPIGVYLRPQIPALGNPMIFMVFYAAGILLSDRVKGVVARSATPLGVAATAAGLAAAIYVAGQLGGYTDPSALGAAVLGILLVLQLAYLLPDAGPMRIIALLGLASMPIYLVHMLCGAVVRMVLIKVFHTTNFPLHLVAGVVFALLLPTIFFYCAYRLGIERWFGFAGGEQAFGRFGFKQGGQLEKSSS
ncbi:acyltransferase family protein [Duganella aceris]|uniref:Acyltransferase n=1 Tax=Duganella aceris TaxID=2703883 RepID=A0ABX0FSZ5_9BURK|nr:acyltransferase [Duganella aceris]NGZ87820.1 acyltransferase [Duganella aceris]